MAKVKIKAKAKAPSTAELQLKTALNKLGEVETESALRAEMLEMSRRMNAEYERRGQSVASALRAIAELADLEQPAMSRHLRREADRLDPPRDAEASRG